MSAALSCWATGRVFRIGGRCSQGQGASGLEGVGSCCRSTEGINLMSSCFSRYPLRGLFVAALLAAVSLVSAGAAQASTLPTLTLAITKSSITVGGTTQSGAVNVISTASGVKEATAILFLMKPGVTVAEVESALKSGAGKDPNKATKYGSIVFDAEANPCRGREAPENLP